MRSLTVFTVKCAAWTVDVFVCVCVFTINILPRIKRCSVLTGDTEIDQNGPTTYKKQ